MDWADKSWSAYGRVAFSITPLILLPFGGFVSRIKYEKILLIVSFFVAFAAISIHKKYHPAIHLSALFASGAALHLMIFRSQVLWSEFENSNKLLLNFSFAQSASSMIAPGLAGLMIDNMKRENMAIFVSFLSIIILLYIAISKAKEMGKFSKKSIYSFLRKEEIKKELQRLYVGCKDDRLKRLNLDTVILSGSITAINVLIPILAINNGWPATKAGLVLSFAGVASFFARFVLLKCRIQEKHERMLISIFSMIAVLSFISLIWVRNIDYAFILAGLFGLASGAAAPISLGMYSGYSKLIADKSISWTMRSFFISITAIATPLLIGGLF